MNDTLFPGDVLRVRREALGFSLRDIHDRIHVPLDFLEGIESGCLDHMPGQAYAQGFLRSYCRFLNLDAESFVDEYLICSRPKRPESVPNAPRRANPDTALARPYPRWFNDFVTWGAICAVIVLAWVTYSAVVRPIAESLKSRVEAGAFEAPQPPIHFNEDF